MRNILFKNHEIFNIELHNALPTHYECPNNLYLHSFKNTFPKEASRENYHIFLTIWWNYHVDEINR